MASPGSTVSTGPAPATVRTSHPSRPSAAAHLAASIADPVAPAQAERDHAGRRHGRTVRAGRGRGAPRRRVALPPMAKRALITGVTGQDGSYLAEFLLVAGLHGHRHGAALEHGQLRAHRPHSGPARAGGRRPARRGLADQHAARPPAQRGLQPGRPVLRPDQLEPAGPDRRDDGHGRHPAARRHPPGRPRASASTRPAPRRCSARCSRSPRRSRRPSTRAAPTAWPRCTGTGSR